MKLRRMNRITFTAMSTRLINCLIKLTLFAMVPLAIVGLTGCENPFVGFLNPKGLIAFQERKLFFDTLALMMIVVLPVIIMSIAFVYHYQVSHRIRDYKPNWSHSYFLESLWWGIPCAIILVLSIITWKKTHELDPYRHLAGHEEKPLIIQVVALPWKWLFIYPELNIASLNYLEIPLGQVVEYQLTTDNVPMSAFFIPQLGSQIYTMAGMRTQLHLLANYEGEYQGMNTQFNGDGFSSMRFTVQVVSPAVLSKWVEQVKHSATKLDVTKYQALLKPSIGNAPEFYSGVQPNLFEDVLKLYQNSVGVLHPRSQFMSYSKQEI